MGGSPVASGLMSIVFKKSMTFMSMSGLKRRIWNHMGKRRGRRRRKMIRE